MTPKQINKLVQQYTKVTLEKCEGERLHNLERVDDDELEAVSLSIIGRLEDNANNVINNDFSGVTRVANSLLAKNNLTVSSNSTPFKKLCRELLIAEQKVHKTELKRWGGDYSDQFISSIASSEPDETSTELLSKVIEAHINEHKNVWEPRGITQAKSSLEKFLEFIGDIPIGT